MFTSKILYLVGAWIWFEIKLINCNWSLCCHCQGRFNIFTLQECLNKLCCLRFWPRTGLHRPTRHTRFDQCWFRIIFIYKDKISNSLFGSLLHPTAEGLKCQLKSPTCLPPISMHRAFGVERLSAAAIILKLSRNFPVWSVETESRDIYPSIPGSGNFLDY
jgi:hypothetical protein